MGYFASQHTIYEIQTGSEAYLYEEVVKVRKRGFTLIELLLVITVIIVLSSIALLNFLQAGQRAKRAAAESFIAQLQTAISMYKIDMGYYPSDKKGSASLREALCPESTDPLYKDTKWKGPYLEFKDKQINNYGEILDPWHKGKDDRVHIYFYQADLDDNPLTEPPFHNKSSYDIYSKGPDGKTGTDHIDGNEFNDGNYCQNEVDDDNDGIIDELNPNGEGGKNGYLEDDVNNW